MKRLFYLIFGGFLIANIFCGCCNGTTESGGYLLEDSINHNFHYDDGGRFIIKVIIDENEYDAIFDTGGGSKVILDKDIFSYLASDTFSIKTVGFPYSNTNMDVMCYENDICVVFNDDTLKYDGYELGDIAKRLNVAVFLPLPIGSDKVWNINYETFNIEVLDDMPEDVITNNDISSPITKHNNRCFISLPFSFLTSDSTKIDCSLNGCFDTGSNCDITLFGGTYCLQNKGIEFILSERQMRINNSRTKICFLKAEGDFNDFVEIETRPDSGGYVAVNFGNAILSHYNFWLDLKNKMMYGKLYSNYRAPKSYIYANGNNTSSIAGSFTDKGFLVRYVVSDSNMEKAGIQKGDLFLSVDGKDINSLTLNDFKQYKCDSLLHDIELLHLGKKKQVRSYFYY